MKRDNVFDLLQILSNDVVSDVRQILKTARSYAYRQTNSAMIAAYWFIGKRIVVEEQKGDSRANYGEQLIKNLSKKLSEEFGKGISVAQLKNFRQFYRSFPNLEKSYTLCSQLSWSHLRLIMRLDTDEERQYYIDNSKAGNWSVRELERNIRTDMFHRVVAHQIPIKSQSASALDVVKDPYILEFLQLQGKENFSEKEFETAIISYLQQFLLELGRGFSFVARQMHIATETNDFYIDLVFYNYLLKCFVLVDLKRGKLTHQDIGQMEMYVRMFDDLKRGEGDNPTMGIVLCADKDETIVKYSVLSEHKQIFASKYRTILPSEEELSREIENNQRYLMSIKEIEG